MVKPVWSVGLGLSGYVVRISYKMDQGLWGFKRALQNSKSELAFWILRSERFSRF